MERVINRKEYRRNYEGEKISESQVLWLKKYIKNILIQSLCVSIIFLVISFLKFYNCSKILSVIKNSLNTEISVASFKENGQIIFDKATNYYDELNKFIEKNIEGRKIIKSLEYRSGDNSIIEKIDLASGNEIKNDLASNNYLITNISTIGLDIAKSEEISGEVYEVAVEGINQMSEDSEYIKENYNVTIPVVGTVTSRFGVRNSNNPIVSSYHSGLDIAANTGTQILAVIEGEVIAATTDTYFGKYIKIKKDDIEMTYAHCSKIFVKVGDKVKKGQLIGYVGNTGNSTGPHLHLEIKYKGRLIDPEDILEI